MLLHFQTRNSSIHFVNSPDRSVQQSNQLAALQAFTTGVWDWLHLNDYWRSIFHSWTIWRNSSRSSSPWVLTLILLSPGMNILNQGLHYRYCQFILRKIVHKVTVVPLLRLLTGQVSTGSYSHEFIISLAVLSVTVTVWPLTIISHKLTCHCLKTSCELVKMAWACGYLQSSCSTSIVSATMKTMSWIIELLKGSQQAHLMWWY